jgi:hypothetical protein
MCLPLAALFSFLIWIACVGVALYIIRLIIEFALPRLGIAIAAEVVALIVKIITVLIWLAVFVFLITIVGNIVICLIGGGGGVGFHRF